MAKKEAAGRRSREKRDDVDFETALAAVEQIVAKLEGGQLGLTESLEQYEAGIRQLKRCQSLLDTAEQRVSMLSGFDADGNPVVQPMPEVTSDGPAGRKKRKVRAKRRVKPDSGSDQPRDDDRSGSPSAEDSVDDSRGLF